MLPEHFKSFCKQNLNIFDWAKDTHQKHIRDALNIATLQNICTYMKAMEREEARQPLFDGQKCKSSPVIAQR